MFNLVFSLLLKIVVLPIGAIYVLSRTFLGIPTAFLGVNIVLTAMLVPLTIWQLIKLVPNLALIRTKNIMRLVVEIAIEIVVLLSFWGVYLAFYLNR